MDINTQNNIFFVGGIHGVGKSTICRRLAFDLKINYLSASKVLKWEEINVDIKNKRVNDIPDTQDRLIVGLNKLIVPDQHYVLDGHFCLFNKDGIAAKIPFETFVSINPKHLVVVIGDTVEISKELQNRDQKVYSNELLTQIQNLEVHYAREISVKLNIPLYQFNKIESDLSYKTLLYQLNESLT